ERFEGHAVFRHGEKTALEHGALLSAGRDRDSATAVRDRLERARGTDPISQTLFVDTTLLLPGNNLVKADRMGMACGLELRCPFLDYRLVELAFTIPGSDRIANGEGKRPLRETLAPVLPSAASRPKRMFGVPLRDWFRSSEHPLLRLLSVDRPRRLDEWIDPRGVARLLEEHRSAAAAHARKLRALLADPRHARPVDLDEAVAELVGGLDDADRQVVPLGAVEGDELAEVHPREEIRVRDDELALQLRKRGGDRARGPERSPVTHVADGHAKAPPVAEVALDQLRLVTDREDDPAEALRREVLYQCGEDRPAGDLDERLRDVAGDVAQPAAETARHDEDRDRLLGGPR